MKRLIRFTASWCICFVLCFIAINETGGGSSTLSADPNKPVAIQVAAARLKKTTTAPGGNVSAKYVEVVRAKIGDGPDEVGAYLPQEAMPEGPTSFAVGAGGEIYILDKLNSRIQVFNNNVRKRSISIKKIYWDIDVTRNGMIVLISDQTPCTAALLKNTGELIRELPLVGRLIPSCDSVSGVHSRVDGTGDGIWIEVEGEKRSVRIADLAGNPYPNRIPAWGMLTLNGMHYIESQVIQVTTIIRLSESAGRLKWQEFKAVFDMPIILHNVFTDRNDNIYQVVHLAEGKESAIIALIRDVQGKEKKRINLAPDNNPYPTLKRYRVSPDGKIYQFTADDDYIIVRRYDP